MLVLVGVGAVVVSQYVGLTPSSASSPSTASPSTDAPDPTTSTPETRPSAPAVVPGWQTVVDDGRSLNSNRPQIAYDVPADWRVSTPDETIPVEDEAAATENTADAGRWRFHMSMLSDHLGGACAPSGMLTVKAPEMAGVGLVVQTHGPADGRAAAEETARHVANFVYAPVGDNATGTPSVTVDRPRQVTVHGVTGYQTTAHVTAHQPARCGHTSGLVDVLALPGPGYSDSTMVVAVSDQQFDGAVDKSVLDRIVTSYRQLS
ncbi:hypothetical protein GCM10029964_059500 [Kibdelosporangium lantanae]